MTIGSSSVAHLRLTATDSERSGRFYESVFSRPVLFGAPDDADQATRAGSGVLSGGVVYDVGGALPGLRPVANARFDEHRAGLDHIALAPTAPE